MKKTIFQTGETIKKNRYTVVLCVAVFVYVMYFSVFTILRSQRLFAHYFDLGIMHQTVYNSFQAIKTGDFSRFLELTNPHGVEQVKRMAIHNDLILGLLVPFYFIHAGPETLLIIQSLILGLGAFAIYGIGLHVFQKLRSKQLLSLLFSLAYLLYPPMQRANIFEFHAVTFATTFLLCMYYFWLKRKYGLSILFLLFSLLTKEQVSLTTLFFGLYVLYKKQNKLWFPFLVVGSSLIWFILSIKVIIPFARGGADHFALNYYADFGDSPTKVFMGILNNPRIITTYIFQKSTLQYISLLLGPLAFLSLLSPIHLFISVPEFAINMLSNSYSMRTILFHYTSVLEPFIFISALYGSKNVLQKHSQSKYFSSLLSGAILILCLFIGYFSWISSPLPYAKSADVGPITRFGSGYSETVLWSRKLANPNIKVSSTGHPAPYFTSRKYFYHFPNGYENADFVFLQLSEVRNYFDKKVDIMGVYHRLQSDRSFRLLYKTNEVEIYQKI